MVNRLPAYKNEDKALARKLLRAQGNTTAQIHALMDPTSIESHYELMGILRDIEARVEELGAKKKEQRIQLFAEADKTTIALFEQHLGISRIPSKAASIVTRKPDEPIKIQRSVGREYEKKPVNNIQKEHSNVDIEIYKSLHLRLFSRVRDFATFHTELFRKQDPQLPSTFDGWVFFSHDPSQFLRLLMDMCSGTKYGEAADIANTIRDDVIPRLQQDNLSLTQAPYVFTTGEGRTITLRNTYDIYNALGQGGSQLLSAILAKIDSKRIQERSDESQDIVVGTPTVPSVYSAQTDVVPDATMPSPTFLLLPKESIHTYIAGKPVDHNGSEVYVPTSGKIRDIVSRLNQYFQVRNILFTALTTDFGTNAFGAPYLAKNIEPERHSRIEEVLNRWKTEESLSVGR